MEKLSLIKIHNPFNRADRDFQVIDHKPLQSLLDIRNEHLPLDVDFSVSVNGKIVQKNELALTYLTSGDQILFVPEIHGGGGGDGKGILGSILMIAVAIAAPFAAKAILGVSTMTFGATLLAAGLTMVGGLLVNALLPPPMPKLPTMDRLDFDTSRTYSWNPQTTQQQGLVVPKFYGTNKLYGNVIAAHIDNINDKQYMNVLIDQGIDPVRRLYDFKINDQPVENFQGVEIHTRLGMLDQPAISNFQDTKTEYPLSVKITNGSPFTYSTIGNNFNGLEIDVTFPQGLFFANDQGGLDAHSVNVRVEIRRQGEAWRPITSQVVATQQTVYSGMWSAGVWTHDDSGHWFWHEYQGGGSNPHSYYEGQEAWIQVRTDPESSYRAHAHWRWINISHIQRVSQTVSHVTISGAQTLAIRRTFKVDHLIAGRYEIRVSNLTVDQTSSRYGDDMFFSAVREVYYDDFEYPRHVLVGIKALATDQLSGSLRFSCMSEGALIRVHNGSIWSVTNSNNPAWVCWDILTQPVFDNSLNIIRYDGIDPSRLDIVKFREWAAFCDALVPNGRGGTEKRITFNGGFDSETTMWEAAMRVCETGRAILVWNGVNLTVAIDMPSVPVQLFTVGSIGIDSFKQTFLPMEDRASEIEIDFVNSEKEYERNKLTVINTAIDGKVNKVNLQLFGITKPSEAWRAGMYRLANNQHITRTIEFDADIDSIACTIGDVINVQHDIPQWGFGGRLASATSNTITLDRKITIDITRSYTVMIRLSNDSIVERNIVNPAQNGDYDTFTVSSAFTTMPVQYDIYTFGEVNKAVKPFRVIAISRTHEQKATITAVEYNSSIYNIDNNQPVIPTIDYSSLNVLRSVSNITLDELIIRGKDGAITNTINVYFTKSSNIIFAHAEIWFNKGGGWIYSGISLTGFHRIENVEASKTYQIAVCTVNAFGEKQSIQNAPKSSIFTLGKLNRPSNVTNFTARQNGQSINFNWLHIPDADLWGYEIRMGISWESARTIATAISQNHYTWQAELNGTYRFLIKALDESGLNSNLAASVDITLRGINEGLNVIFSQDEMTKANPADGIRTNFIYINQFHALMIPHTLTDTDVPTRIDTTPAIMNYRGDISLNAEYITNAIDTFKVGDTWIRIQEALNAIDTGATDQSYPSRTDLLYPEDTDTHITMPVDFTIFYQISNDNITYSAWKRYMGAVQENFRFVRVRIAVNIASQTGRLKLNRFLLSFDVPDVNKTIRDLAIAAATGTSITFSSHGLNLYTVPVVRAFVKNATGSRAPLITNLTAAGCHIDIYDTANAKVAGTVDLEISGY